MKIGLDKGLKGHTLPELLCLACVVLILGGFVFPFVIKGIWVAQVSRQRDFYGRQSIQQGIMDQMEVEGE